MEDMKILWGTSVQMLDEYRKGSFTLRAIIFVTVGEEILCPGGGTHLP
jgi:hypothetical protein